MFFYNVAARRVLLFARPQIALQPTPLKKYCSPDPSNILNLCCDPNMKNFPSKILGPILCMVTNLFRLKKVSISTGLRDQNLAKGRPNSISDTGTPDNCFLLVLSTMLLPLICRSVEEWLLQQWLLKPDSEPIANIHMIRAFSYSDIAL